ncbi:hypothetical protein KEM60_00486 [Austwickia sp. TVS 96-490-7B]|uniref:transposase family protein n=1 Tax=Austwickia sp. TVS 96-490-7B TaxID=2830843 RepID=UPI001C5858AA|nr:transposase family protein [Austwickia sp. TVS 96-490-7B]MBW3084299.1 hypothetical protein [Austwickia sp. TVS 96-490-7B]
MPVKEHVILTLELLRNTLAQMFLADLLHISQSTASRIHRRMLLVINEALTFTSISLEEAASDGRAILIDGTYAPTGNRPAQGQEVAKATYSGQRRCQCVSIQVASTLTGHLETLRFSRQRLSRQTHRTPRYHCRHYPTRALSTWLVAKNDLEMPRE